VKAPEVLDIVIPMAGRGSRFANVGIKLPKPLVDVGGVPMIQRVIENLRPNCKHRFIFLALQEHLTEYQLAEKLKKWAGSQTICVPIQTVTEGAACTVLLARENFKPNHDMMIANSDQLVDIDINDYINFSRDSQADGTIMTFEATDPKWSFAKLNSRGEVTEVAEKKPISNLATVGIYYYRRGTDFVTKAEEMIRANIRVNNEFYVCPVYNQMIAAKQRIFTWSLDQAKMHGIGTPEDLALYLEKAK
jgi:NDP-sugar pyrophosphorylase family protein